MCILSRSFIVVSDIDSVMTVFQSCSSSLSLSPPPFPIDKANLISFLPSIYRSEPQNIIFFLSSLLIFSPCCHWKLVLFFIFLLYVPSLTGMFSSTLTHTVQRHLFNATSVLLYNSLGGILFFFPMEGGRICQIGKNRLCVCVPLYSCFTLSPFSNYYIVFL